LKSKEGNICFSPFSASLAMSMAYGGARGKTEAEMSNVLHVSLPQSRYHQALGRLQSHLGRVSRAGRAELSVANALWTQSGYDVLAPFLALAQKQYRANINQVDFATSHQNARKELNKWVEQRTRRRITDLIGPGVFDPDTRVALVNAMYFRGRWAAKFDKRDTTLMPFAVRFGETVNIPMMRQTQTFRYADNDVLQVLELPYVGKNLAMLLFLPKDPTGLAELEAGMTVNTVTNWISGLASEEVTVFVPRFSVTSSFLLSDALSRLGMPSAFGPKADFSGMNGKNTLFLSAVLHKAGIDVDEVGTTAWAATAAVATESIPDTFRADHPFIFIVHDTISGTILFMGRVTNPRT
jgi:serpin B